LKFGRCEGIVEQYSMNVCKFSFTGRFRPDTNLTKENLDER
jgi:hypothetical protein